MVTPGTWPLVLSGEPRSSPFMMTAGLAPLRWPWGSHWKTRDSFPRGAPMRPPVGCWGSRMRPASPGGSVLLVPAPHPVPHSYRQGERGRRSVSRAEPQPGLVAASLPASAGAAAQVSRLRPNEPCQSVCVCVCMCAWRVPCVFSRTPHWDRPLTCASWCLVHQRAGS